MPKTDIVKDFNIDFIGVGTGKAATSWIAKCLDEHPALCVAARKETNFFYKNNFNRGLGWYAAQFNHCASNNLRGEFSPRYFDDDLDAARRIHDRYPEVKILICLRNPVEKFLSARYFKAITGRGLKEDFDENVLEHFAPTLQQGLYARRIRKYCDFFPRSQIFIMLYEDISPNPLKFIQEIYRFLEVDDTFVPPSHSGRVNVTSPNAVRFRALHAITTRLHQLVAKGELRQKYLLPVLEKIGVGNLYRMVRSYNWHNANRATPMKKAIDPHLRQKLRNYYSKDIKEVEKLIGRDLSFWK